MPALQVLMEKGEEVTVVVEPESKWTMTVLFSGSAAGELLPPLFVYKSKTIRESWLKGAPTGSAYACSPRGWVINPTMVAFLETIVAPYFRRVKNDLPKVLLIDNFR